MVLRQLFTVQPEKLNAIGINNVMKLNRLTSRSVIKQLRERIIFIKLLGVNFDEKLTFSQHISQLCKTSQSEGGRSRQVKKFNNYGD